MIRLLAALLVALPAALLVALPAAASLASARTKDLPRPGEIFSVDGPVKVYILAGQSNMVGIGQVSGSSTRWGEEILDPVVSVYPGPYSAEADYDAIAPLAVRELPAYGGVEPTPFPGGGVHVVRGAIELDVDGTYEFSPGYAGSTYNVMEVGGVEVYRREVGEEPVRRPFRFTAGRRVPFEITFFTDAANGLGWLRRTDVPGTLTTVVKTDGKSPHLVDDEGRWVVRDDVGYKGLVTATADRALTVGCGANADSIGPELQFGHVLGDHHDEPVLLLKTSQGNRSLGWDFLPPGSERFTHEGRTYAGYGDRVPSWTADAVRGDRAHPGARARAGLTSAVGRVDGESPRTRSSRLFISWQPRTAVRALGRTTAVVRRMEGCNAGSDGRQRLSRNR